MVGYRRSSSQAPVPVRTGPGAWASWRRSPVNAALSVVLAAGLLGIMAYAPLGAAVAIPQAAQQVSGVVSTQQLDAVGAMADVSDRSRVTAKEAPEPVVETPAAGAGLSLPDIAPGTVQAYARERAAKRGWYDEQFACLLALWNKESHWNYKAENPTSGAYGIPQSYPGEKMASHGADWRTNPETQINWGLDYIGSRWGNPCGAWANSQSQGWY